MLKRCWRYGSTGIYRVLRIASSRQKSFSAGALMIYQPNSRAMQGCHNSDWFGWRAMNPDPAILSYHPAFRACTPPVQKWRSSRGITGLRDADVSTYCRARCPLVLWPKSDILCWTMMGKEAYRPQNMDNEDVAPLQHRHLSGLWPNRPAEFLEDP